MDESRLDEFIEGGHEKYETYETKLYVSRAVHRSGDVVPGKYHARDRATYIGKDYEETRTDTFELLKNDQDFFWLPSNNGDVPLYAVVGGKTSTGENLYIGRAQHGDHLMIGRIQPSSKCLFVPFNTEHKKNEYEVLVKLPNGKCF